MKRLTKEILVFIVIMIIFIGFIFIPDQYLNDVVEILGKVLCICLITYIAYDTSRKAFIKMEKCEEISQLVAIIVFLLVMIAIK